MSTDLTVLPEVTETNAVTVFKPEGTDPIIEGVKQLMEEFKLNPPSLITKAGRAKYKSFASDIARSKTHVEKIGRKLASDTLLKAEDIIAQDKAIRAEVIRFTKQMDALRDEAKAPAIQWELADAERKHKHETELERLQSLKRSGNEYNQPQSSDTLKMNLEFAKSVDLSKESCQEYQDEYTDLINEAIELLTNDFIPTAEKRENDEAELIALRQQQQQQEAINKANEQARIDKLKAEQSQKDAELRVEQMEKQRVIDAENAELRRIEDEKQAELRAIEREKQAAIDTENRLKADALEKEKAMRQRAANQEHKKAFNREALAAIMEASGITQEQGIEVLKAIINEQVPHLTMSY